jgi:hypothetical protein
MLGSMLARVHKRHNDLKLMREVLDSGGFEVSMQRFKSYRAWGLTHPARGVRIKRRRVICVSSKPT